MALRSSSSCSGAGPTLRTTDGERVLDEATAVHVQPGPDGAHSVSNQTSEPARYLMVSTLPSPEVAEYPDLGKVTARRGPAPRPANGSG